MKKLMTSAVFVLAAAGALGGYTLTQTVAQTTTTSEESCPSHNPSCR